MNLVHNENLYGTNDGMDQSVTRRKMVTVRDTGEQYLELSFNADRYDGHVDLVHEGGQKYAQRVTRWVDLNSKTTTIVYVGSFQWGSFQWGSYRSFSS